MSYVSAQAKCAEPSLTSFEREALFTQNLKRTAHGANDNHPTAEQQAAKGDGKHPRLVRLFD